MFEKIRAKIRAYKAKREAKILVRTAKEKQPAGYITLVYAPGSKQGEILKGALLNDIRGGAACAVQGDIIAVAFRADDQFARRVAINYIQGTPLVRGEMEFISLNRT